MPVKMNVPYAEKDAAKAAAMAAGGKLLWKSDEKAWFWSGTVVPSSLERWLPSSAGSDRWNAIDIPFEFRSLATALGAKWDAESKVAWVKGEVHDLLKPYRPKAYGWEWWQEFRKNETMPSPWSPKNPWKAKSHQKLAADAMSAALHAGYPGFLLADGTGLGKTMSLWSFVLQEPKIQRILIVPPASVMAHWRSTFLSAGDGGKQVLLLNYDRLGRLFEVKSNVKVKSKKGLAKFGSAPEFDLIVLDESHKVKNPTAARSKMTMKLQAEAEFVVWMSATAGQTPLELSYMAPLLAARTGARVSDMKDFEAWCLKMGLGVRRGAFGKWEWDGNIDDCERIEEWLFGGDVPCGMRRRPQEIAGWHELERQLFPVELSGAERSAYESAWQDFKKGGSSSGKKGADKANALVRQLRFRQKGSLVRLPSTVDRVLDILESGTKVAVSVAFRETQDEMRKMLEKSGIRVSVMHGQQSEDEKESNRLAFQKETVDVCIFTQEEGISLHQGEHGNSPRILLIHDIRWSAIQMSQVEGRCHRDGKFAPVVWCFAEDSVEEDIVKVVSARVVAMGTMMGDADRGLLDEIEQVLSKR